MHQGPEREAVISKPVAKPYQPSSVVVENDGQRPMIGKSYRTIGGKQVMRQKKGRTTGMVRYTGARR